MWAEVYLLPRHPVFQPCISSTNWLQWTASLHACAFALACPFSILPGMAVPYAPCSTDMILQFCRSRKFRWSLFQKMVLLRLNSTEPIIIVVIGTVCEDVWRATLHLLLIQQTHTGPCRDRPIAFWSYCSWFWHLLRLQDIRLRCTGTW